MQIPQLIITFGIILILVGIIWLTLSKYLPSPLPGDFQFKTKNTTIYFPLATSIIISIILTIILNIILRSFNK